jgi:hypothetical protein
MHKRRHARRTPDSPINVQFLLDGYLVAHGDVADLSHSGAGLWTDGGFLPGDRVELRLRTEDRWVPIVEAAATFVWSHCSSGSQRTRYGVRWDAISSADRRALQTLIKENGVGGKKGAQR